MGMTDDEYEALTAEQVFDRLWKFYENLPDGDPRKTHRKVNRIRRYDSKNVS